MTKPKKPRPATPPIKSEGTILGQLTQSVAYTNVVDNPKSGTKVERYQLSAGSLEDRLAQRIQKYWGERGHFVDIRVREVPYHRGKDVTHYRAARSNLVNGLPIGYKEPQLSISAQPQSQYKKEKIYG